MTIRDIAKLAGVSHTTVSRVLNDSDKVKPETRDKILHLVKELNFSPHTSARALVSGKTNNIGLLILYDLKQFPLGFLPDILAGMSATLNEFGYSLTLLFDQIDEKKNQVSLNLITKDKMDGVFILSVESDAQVAFKVGNIHLPLVLVNQKVEGLELNYVSTDDEGGAYQAISHLLDLGHTKIGLITGTPKFSTSTDRKAGYIRALNERGIHYDSSLEKIGHFDKNLGYIAMKELLQERPDITAVFAENDLMALGAMKAIKEKNLKIPEDIAVVGFDDAEFAEVIDPSLTTVKKYRTMMGKEAAILMLELLNNKNNKKYKQIVLPTKLMIRESTVLS